MNKVKKYPSLWAVIAILFLIAGILFIPYVFYLWQTPETDHPHVDILIGVMVELYFLFCLYILIKHLHDI